MLIPIVPGSDRQLREVAWLRLLGEPGDQRDGTVACRTPFPGPEYVAILMVWTDATPSLPLRIRRTPLPDEMFEAAGC